VKPRTDMFILDYGGGGNATLARALAKLFIQNGAERVEIDLVDYNANCRSDWGKTTVHCHNSLATASERSFDLVIASAIVEHLPDPRPALIELLQALRPGAAAYFRTPAMSTLACLLGRLGIQLDLAYPAHCHDMGQRFWESILETLGLSESFSISRSKPSIVETEFGVHPITTIAAYAAKAPWYVFRRAYTLVGGWEVVIRKNI
jgi:2-polyprenyl-3-methyl-5-hydroxy-6-metoxy-1,4-benzoquinol methylase